MAISNVATEVQPAGRRGVDQYSICRRQSAITAPACYRGLAHLQHGLTALALNLVRVNAWLTGTRRRQPDLTYGKRAMVG